MKNSASVATLSLVLADVNVTSLSPLKLARTVNMNIAAGAHDTFTATHSPLGDMAGCAIDTGVSQGSSGWQSGIRPYQTTQLAIDSTGTLTFRIVSTSPKTDMNSLALAPGSAPLQQLPILDPWLAVYTSFDPAHPDQNVVGCQDDSARPPGSYFDDGTVPQGVWSQFDATLPPGTYTLVLGTYLGFDDSQWTTATTAPTLAATGSSGLVLPFSLGFAVLGFGVLAVSVALRRRRSS